MSDLGRSVIAGERWFAVAEEQQRALADRLNGGGGGGTSGGMPTDGSAQDLKPRVDFLHTAFLWLAGVIVAAIGTLVIGAVSLTASTSSRLDRGVEATSTLNREVGQLSVKVDEVNQRLARIEAKLDAAAGGRAR